MWVSLLKKGCSGKGVISVWKVGAQERRQSFISCLHDCLSTGVARSPMLTWAIVPNDSVKVRPLDEWVAQLLPRQLGSRLNHICTRQFIAINIHSVSPTWLLGAGAGWKNVRIPYTGRNLLYANRDSGEGGDGERELGMQSVRYAKIELMIGVWSRRIHPKVVCRGWVWVE